MAAAPLFSTYQVARFFTVSPRTIEKWVRDGRLIAAAGTDRDTWKFAYPTLIGFADTYGLPKAAIEQYGRADDS